MSHVRLLRCADSDLDVVNAARASFGKEVEEMSLSDEQLIEYLATGLRRKERLALVNRILACGRLDSMLGTGDDENEPFRMASAIIDEIQAISKHWAPFAHPVARFHLKAPLFVARQLWRSHVGAGGGDEQFAWSEESRRYLDGEPEFHKLVWRERAQDVKQGSGGLLADAADAEGAQDSTEVNAVLTYQALLRMGVAPEQARALLPQTLMVTWVWTGSLAFWARVCVQRLDMHAQGESRDVAVMLSAEMAKLFPVSWKALVLRGREV